MRKPIIQPEPQSNISLQIAPMVNLMLVLIAVFTVTMGSKIIETELGVKVPQREGDSPKEVSSYIKLNISEKGDIRFNGFPIAQAGDTKLDHLKSRLKTAIDSQGARQPVMIIPEDATKHSRVIDAINACAAVGITHLSFSGT